MYVNYYGINMERLILQGITNSYLLLILLIGITMLEKKVEIFSVVELTHI